MIENLPPVTNVTLEKRVYNELLRAIVFGKLKPGTKITLTELADQFGVSQMPVRQALKSLEAKKLVHIQKNRRLIIKDLSTNDLDEIFRIRIVLEQMAAEEAVKKCSVETIRRVRKVLNEMNGTEGIEEYIKKNQEFHYTIYKCAGKPVLFEVIQDLWYRVSHYMYLYLIIENVKPHDAYHEKILKGMEDRDAETVARWLKIDLEKAAEELRIQLVKRSVE